MSANNNLDVPEEPDVEQAEEEQGPAAAISFFTAARQKQILNTKEKIKFKTILSMFQGLLVGWQRHMDMQLRKQQYYLIRASFGVRMLDTLSLY